jgi:hypothetical protein
MKFLVAGWFSFEQMGATAGDLMARDVACEWLENAGIAFDIATAPPFTGGIPWRTADPSAYSHVLFVCGPFGNGEPVTAFLNHFSGRKLIGLNLSMLQHLSEWNPFTLLIERDSSHAVNPDLAFASTQALVPVVGLVLVHRQKEYRGSRHEEVHAAIRRLPANRQMCVVNIDTRLDVNSNGFRTAAEVESLIARMDAVVTTRLHGTVLSIRNGVPPVAIDPIAGGAKILHQARAIGWPVVLTADEITDTKLQAALDFCLSDEARREARMCAARARASIEAMRDRFLTAVNDNEYGASRQ